VKGFPSKRIEWKIDVIGPKNILFAARPRIIQPRFLLGWGSQGVNTADSSENTRSSKYNQQQQIQPTAANAVSNS